MGGDSHSRYAREGVKLYQEVLAESLWMDMTGNANLTE